METYKVLTFQIRPSIRNGGNPFSSLSGRSGEVSLSLITLIQEIVVRVFLHVQLAYLFI